MRAHRAIFSELPWPLRDAPHDLALVITMIMQLYLDVRGTLLFAARP